MWKEVLGGERAPPGGQLMWRVSVSGNPGGTKLLVQHPEVEGHSDSKAFWVIHPVPLFQGECLSARMSDVSFIKRGDYNCLSGTFVGWGGGVADLVPFSLNGEVKSGDGAHLSKARCEPELPWLVTGTRRGSCNVRFTAVCILCVPLASTDISQLNAKSDMPFEKGHKHILRARCWWTAQLGILEQLREGSQFRRSESSLTLPYGGMSGLYTESAHTQKTHLGVSGL